MEQRKWNYSIGIAIACLTSFGEILYADIPVGIVGGQGITYGSSGGNAYAALLPDLIGLGRSKLYFWGSR